MSINYFSSFKTLFPFPLRDYQIETFQQISKADKHTIICQPTGAGKTSVAEYYFYVAAEHKKKAIFTVPLRALSSEKLNEWKNPNWYLRKKYPLLEILEDNGGTYEKRNELKESYYDNWDILITTNERLLNILKIISNRSKILSNVEFIVFDEIHLLGSKGRGGVVEFLLMLLKTLFPHIKIIGLSATLPNAKDFSQWLSSDLIEVSEKERPVPLEDYYKVGNKQYKKKLLLDQFTKYEKDQFLVFLSSRKRCQELAFEFREYRTAYHHAGIDDEKKKLIEENFKKGNIRIIFCTPTLAQGINLPCTNVIIYDLSRWNSFISDFELLEHYELGQMRGRAGRPQYDQFGRCFYFGTEEEIFHAKRSNNNPSPMISNLDDFIDEKILMIIVCQIGNTLSEILTFFNNSFAEFQGRFDNYLIQKTISYLEKEGFIRNNEGRFTATPIGEKTCKLSLKPMSIIQIRNNLHISDFSVKSLLMSFIGNYELLGDIQINDNDDPIISEILQHYSPLYLNWEIYDPSTKSFQYVECTEQLCKLFGLLIQEDLLESNSDIRGIFISQNELNSLKKNTKAIISKAFAVLSNTSFNKNISHQYLTDDLINLVYGAIDLGTLNIDQIKLRSITGIGEKTMQQFKKLDILSIESFLKTPIPVLQNNFDWSILKINKLRQEMIMKYPKLFKSPKKPEITVKSLNYFLKKHNV